ncbi:MAG: discoidin domain-containing protein, partial [Streptomyces sp.]|nr:discoidin domain-containing protein [Streptomyces sp.]
SRIPLFTAADYAWNPRAYAPEESWRAAIADLAAGDVHRERALAALAGNDASSVLDDEESAYLRPLLEAYWRTRLAPETQATDRLRTAFTVMRETPDRLSRTPLATETAPWTSQLARYGEAGVTALDMLDAQRRGDTATAWTSYRTLDRLRTRIDAAPVTVGKGVLDPFLTRAQKSYESWAGLTHEPNRPTDGRTLHFPRPRPLSTVTALTDPGTTGTVEAHVPGKGWQGLGPLTPSGATELPTTLHADAIRVTGPSPSRIHHLIPWYADAPPAELTLNDHHEEPTTETGSTLRLTPRLTPQHPEDLSGRLTAKAPKGIEVRVLTPEPTVPRGTTIETPIEVTIPPNTPTRAYDIQLTFTPTPASPPTTQTLTIHAFPPTQGPDLARTGTATSSADETPDFPARAANDGDPTTRWSSPAEDDAWWQVRLARPVHLGRMVLHWQEAHPSSYRVQVSEDGHHWRTAATVTKGREGRQELRMDERKVRYARVQGGKRATRYGYSLWSVEAYEVTPTNAGEPQ